MDFFSRYHKPHPVGECSRCPTPLGEFYVTLSRTKLSARGVGAAAFPSLIDPKYSELIAAYCMGCGPKAAKSKLEALGVALENKPLTRWASRCGCCGIHPVEFRAPNTLYSVNIKQFNGWVVHDVLGELVDVLTCLECETAFTDPDTPSAAQGTRQADSLLTDVRP